MELFYCGTIRYGERVNCSQSVTPTTLIIPLEPGGGIPILRSRPYWGCAAGQGAFFSFQLWHFFYLLVLAPVFGMFFADISGHYHPNSTNIFQSHSR